MSWETRAKTVIAGGVTHDSWATPSDPVIFDHAKGAYKWDVHGKQYIDFWIGHGALILGHNHPDVISAVQTQIEKGSHLSGNHSNLIQWSEKVVQMIPCAEQVRFCASGTEATLLALRLARAHTGRPYIVRIDGHFHGWHDEALAGVAPGWPLGSHPTAEQYIRLAPPNDIAAISELLSDQQVAILILEPGGGSSGILPYDDQYLRELRQLTTQTGTLLLFDEVMSGFRYAPGGVQQLSGVTPDITTLSKVLCGGLPGAAIAGRREVMASFELNSSHKVVHSGTFNGNPLSAAAGLATLKRVDDASLQQNLTDATAGFVSAVNRRAQTIGVDIRLFSQASIFHILIGAIQEEVPIEPSAQAMLLAMDFAPAYHLLKRALSDNGIDMHKSHGWLSTCHTPEILQQAETLFAQVFAQLASNTEFTCLFNPSS